MIPGINHRGFRWDKYSVADLERKIMAEPMIYPVNLGSFSPPRPQSFLNNNYAYHCFPFRPKVDGDGDCVIIKQSCYQCRIDSSAVVRPELNAGQRQDLGKGEVGFVNKHIKCKICRNCGLILCDKHQNDNTVNHYDVAYYMKNEQDKYKERCNQYN